MSQPLQGTPGSSRLGNMPVSRAPANAQMPPTSMTNILLNPLHNLQALSQVLFQSLSPPQSKPPPPPPPVAFMECDVVLAAAIERTRTHQTKQRRIEALKREVLALEARWREIVAALEEGRRDLEAMITLGDERIRVIEEARAGKSYYYLCSIAA
jgi:mediator of RNA polymerase II transcription subunit 4